MKICPTIPNTMGTNQRGAEVRLNKTEASTTNGAKERVTRTRGQNPPWDHRGEGGLSWTGHPKIEKPALECRAGERFFGTVVELCDVDVIFVPYGKRRWLEA